MENKQDLPIEPTTEALRESFREREWEEIFREVPNGYKIGVYRVTPKWDAGYLGKEVVISNRPLDLDYLRDQWGGQILELRVLDERGRYTAIKTIEISGPPRREGIIQHHPDLIHAAQLDQKQKQTPQDNSLLLKLIENQEKAAQRAQDMLLSRLEKIEETRIEQAEPPKSSLDNIKETIDTLSVLKDAQSNFGLGGNDSEFNATISDIMGQYFGFMIEKERSKVEQQTNQAHQQQKRQESSPKLEERKQTEENDLQDERQEDLQDDQDELDEMDHIELASVMRDKYKNLNPDEKREVMAVFMGQRVENREDEDNMGDGYNSDDNKNNENNKENTEKEDRPDTTNVVESENNVKQSPAVLDAEDEALINGSST